MALRIRSIRYTLEPGILYELTEAAPFKTVGAADQVPSISLSFL